MSHGRHEIHHIYSFDNQNKKVLSTKAGLSKILADATKYPLSFIVTVAKNHVNPQGLVSITSLRDDAVGLAAKYDRVDVMQWLVNEMHCPVNIRPLEYHPVIIAIENQRTNALSWLIAIGAAEGMHVLKRMIRHDQFEIVIWLIEKHIAVFLSELQDKTGDTVNQFSDYLDKLDDTQLGKMKDSLNRAIERVSHDDGTILDGLIKAIEMTIEGVDNNSNVSSVLNTPSTQDSLFTVTPENGSPIKQSMLYTIGHFHTSSPSIASALSTSPQKKSHFGSMTHFNAESLGSLMDKLALLELNADSDATMQMGKKS